MKINPDFRSDIIISHTNSSGASIENALVSAYVIPTATPESDGTLEWDKTTMVLVEINSGRRKGIGYSYADQSTALFIREHLLPVIKGKDAMDIGDCWVTMNEAIRNLGKQGIAAMAISAVDNALWDLKCKLLELPLLSILGKSRDKIPLYGSGGFTSYSDDQLRKQFEDWMASGIRMFKMKIGREPERDMYRVKIARQVIGDDAKLFVDANGAFTVKQALLFAAQLSEYDVSWFEEPVISDDLDGLSFIRKNAPAEINISAGEYGYDLFYFKNMLAAEAVDVLQVDATRCMGITGLLKAGVLCEAYNTPLSTHCAPALHVHPCCAISKMIHAEYFYDHVRIEEMFFDGNPKVQNGFIQPDLMRPGLGLELKASDAEKFRVM